MHSEGQGVAVKKHMRVWGWEVRALGLWRVVYHAFKHQCPLHINPNRIIPNACPSVGGLPIAEISLSLYWGCMVS